MCVNNQKELEETTAQKSKRGAISRGSPSAQETPREGPAEEREGGCKEEPQWSTLPPAPPQACPW